MDNKLAKDLHKRTHGSLAQVGGTSIKSSQTFECFVNPTKKISNSRQPFKVPLGLETYISEEKPYAIMGATVQGTTGYTSGGTPD